ncbi:MAG TPA: DUF3820 family protein [Bacteroidales bacterium]|jgi:uncharacterized protein (DUF3820 family)|nr:DUF3820 family protein [Bacteroidales bacterium]
MEQEALAGGLRKELLLDLVRMRMPYGKYKDRVLCDLPEFYLVWMAQKGFPKGKLGTLLATLYEIKVNGLEYLLKPLR